VAASQREAATQSKDPYDFTFSPRNLTETMPSGSDNRVKMLGVLRLRPPIRKRMGELRSG